jgi:hypothetical protein
MISAWCAYEINANSKRQSSSGWDVRTNVAGVAATILLCGCSSFGLGGQNNVTVTTDRRMLDAPGCKFVGNVAESADVKTKPDNTSAADDVQRNMQRDVAEMGGNVLLLLSSGTGGYGSAVRSTGEGWWCPGQP